MINDAREVLTTETKRRFDLDYVPQPCNPAAVSEEQVAEARAAMRRVYRGLYGETPEDRALKIWEAA